MIGYPLGGDGQAPAAQGTPPPAVGPSLGDQESLRQSLGLPPPPADGLIGIDDVQRT